MDNALIIFIKNPVKGQVKTRIARTAGDAAALDIYLELLKITYKNASILRGVNVYVFYGQFIELDDEWSDIAFQKQVQRGEDLGKRMYNAFDLVLQTPRHVCIIGSDCPTLSAEILDAAFENLTTYDCVVGPSTDGGYYLLGIKNKENQRENTLFTLQFIFENMAWSTDKVLSETLKRLAEQHQTVFYCPN